MRLRVLRVVAYVSKMSYTVTQKTWFLWGNLQKTAKKKTPENTQKVRGHTAVRPAKRSDLKSIYPFVFRENVIFQNRHKNCQILIVNKLKKTANSMSRFSIYWHSGYWELRVVIVEAITGCGEGCGLVVLRRTEFIGMWTGIWIGM